MKKYYTFYKDLFYTCDGGVNPGYHHPRNVKIREREDGTCEIWTGATMDKKTYPNLDAAVNNLKENYDSVLFNAHNLITRYKPSEPIQLK